MVSEIHQEQIVQAAQDFLDSATHYPGKLPDIIEKQARRGVAALALTGENGVEREAYKALLYLERIAVYAGALSARQLHAEFSRPVDFRKLVQGVMLVNDVARFPSDTPAGRLVRRTQVAAGISPRR